MHVLQKLYLTCHCVIFVCQVATAETNERVDFNSQIRPLLSDRVRGLSPAAHYADLDF